MCPYRQNLYMYSSPFACPHRQNPYIYSSPCVCPHRLNLYIYSSLLAWPHRLNPLKRQFSFFIRNSATSPKSVPVPVFDCPLEIIWWKVLLSPCPSSSNTCCEDEGADTKTWELGDRGAKYLVGSRSLWGNRTILCDLTHLPLKYWNRFKLITFK